MCGIAGVIYKSGSPTVSRDLLQSMVAPLRPRGPDGTGYLERPGIGLAHARLSIIDIDGGAQPIHNEDRTIWTVFNGEIFNYIELRRDLEARGHRFYTHTDTEVIVHLYEVYGDEFVHHLNGQFAIALWDENLRRLLLVRDRAGILPLFVCESAERLLFGSEIKAILPALDTRPSLNPTALDQLMTFWSPVSPQTMFTGIEEVRPGEMIVVEGGRANRRRYWDWQFPTDGAYLEGSVETLTEELRSLLVDATQIRLRSDVPVGAYLSGGLDSSGIAALVKHHGQVPLRTFSITFDDAAVDESSHQRRMIQHLQADHSTIACKHGDIAANFPQAIYRTEAPVLRTAPVPMMLLSGLVRDMNYKVVLTGEGADEVLGGYDIFKEAKIRRFWARNADSAFRASLLRRLYPYLELNQRQSMAYLKSFFGQGLNEPALPYFSHLPRWSTTAMCKTFFSPDFATELRGNAIDTLMQGMPGSLPAWHPFNRGQYLEAHTLMSGYLLCSQGDRMLMANSVEGRFPFLDHRLMEFANRLPPKLKMKALTEKYLLKRALAPYLPRSTVSRHKQPYRAPDIAAFFRDGKPPDYVTERMSSAAIEKAGIFDSKRVDRLMEKARRGRAIGAKDNMAFVGILSTQLWHYIFCENAYTSV